jgi:leucyl-tRNA synthetase
LRQGITKYGADPVRIGVLATAELGQDTDFSEALVVSIQERLAGLISQARKLRQARARPKDYSKLDRWMLNRLNEVVRTATESMEKLRVREVINKALYQLDNDLAWYQRRLGPKKTKGGTRGPVLRKVLETRARLLAPIAPHTAEEVWSLLGNRGLVAKAAWPEEDARLKNSGAEQAELLVRGVLEDTSEILKTTGLTPKRVVYYATAAWKWRIYRKALEASARRGEPGDFIREVMSEPSFREMGRTAADYAGKVARQARETPEELRKTRLELGEFSEKEVLEEASGFLGRELRAKVEVWREGEGDAYDPKGRARLAEPFRPAIFVE